MPPSPFDATSVRMGVKPEIGDHAFHARIERGGVKGHRASHRIAEQRDALRVDQRILFECVDSGARVFHHAAHLRPVRITVIERRGLRHAAAEAALIVRQHRVSRLREREDRMQVRPVHPHIAERITVAVQPDHGRELRAWRRVGGIVKIAAHAIAEGERA